ncbi:MAG: hypothetical protein GY782_01890 [Gammaproteobacteria bacterium]|nr:hypothetical protein [Gammaproteobacteria bacterium]
MEPPAVITPGQFHRFPGIGKQKGNTSGWCCLFNDRRGGCFGDWASGLSETWQANRHQAYSHAEKVAFSQEIESVRRRAADELSKCHEEAAHYAVGSWQNTSAASTDHPYLLKKHISPYTAREYNNSCYAVAS